MDPRQLGNFGERIACYYLKEKGYKILDRNYSKDRPLPSKGEIDIVAKRDETLSFIEVKTALFSQSADFLPEDKVNLKKQKKLIKLAQAWLLERKINLESKWEIDVISIKLNPKTKKAKVRHFKNVISQR